MAKVLAFSVSSYPFASMGSLVTSILWFATGVWWAKAGCSIFPAQATQGIVKSQKTELLHPPIFQFFLYRQQSQPKQNKKEAVSAAALGELCESVEKKAGCVRLSVSVHAWMDGCKD